MFLGRKKLIPKSDLIYDLKPKDLAEVKQVSKLSNLIISLFQLFESMLVDD
jgi:hypothetical protein